MAFSLVLFAYDRPHQLERTLVRLRETGILGMAADVRAFLDAPKEPSNKSAVDDCNILLEQLGELKPTEVWRHSENRGVHGMLDDLDRVFRERERILVVEDDILFEPESVELLQVGWDWIASFPEVMSIGFYQAVRFPFLRQGFFLSPRFTCWGWMTTAERWNQVRKAPIPGPADPLASSAATADIERLIRNSTISAGRSSWDYVIAAQMLSTGMQQLVPRHSLTGNTGLHNGVHGSNSFLQRLHVAKINQSRSPAGLTASDVRHANSWYRNYMRLLTRG